MKILAICFLVVAPVMVSAASPEPFIHKAVGLYELLTNEYSPPDCPELFEAVELEDDSLTLLNLNRSNERAQKKFLNINGAIHRTEYSLGYYIDRLSKLDDKTVFSYARLCEGLLHVECGRWFKSSSFTLTGSGAKVSVTPAGAKLDRSGFPVGTCQYLGRRYPVPFHVTPRQ